MRAQGMVSGQKRSCFPGYLAALLCAFFLSAASNAHGQAVTGLAATRVASGLSQPLFATAPPRDYNRLFIVLQTGQVYILNLATGARNATPFLNIQSRLTSTSGEQGLLGMAFDPNYATNGKFYLNFVVPGGAFGNGTTHISQFQVSANPDVADTSVEKILLTFDHPENNHNGGWIAFSPRVNDANNLYISTGDGGNGNDQGNGHIEPGGNAQNLTTLLGKLLRIQINSAAGTASIPANNPFVNTSGARGEIFAYGLRNPFRDSFDRLTGRLFIGDVGQDTREEIDVQLPSNPNGGENYGWRLREGTIATPSGNPVVGGSPPPGNVEPILDYPRSTGGTTIGGYVYRGKQIPALTGTYVFGDYLNTKIFTLNYDGVAASNFQAITGQLFPTSVGGFNLANPSGFGEDANGEIYIADIGNGNVYKIVPVTPSVTINSVNKDAQTGHILVHGFGVPFKTHSVQTTADLTQSFTTVGTVLAAGDGSLQYDDGTPGTKKFYRFTFP
jgi:glucose/arabinose dehydrogenase